MSNENERKQKLIMEAIQNKGKGISISPDPITAERHREFLKTKKGTHGDYNFSPDDETERVRGNIELGKRQIERKLSQCVEGKEAPILLSEQVDRELKENPHITVIGKGRSFSESKLTQMFIEKDPVRSVPVINLKTLRGVSVAEDLLEGSIINEVYCGLKNPVLDRDELQEKLETLTETTPTETIPFEKQYGTLKWGQQIYREELGDINTYVNIDVDPESQKKLGRFAYLFGLSKKSTLKLSQITRVHLYPDENLARWIYAYDHQRFLFDFPVARFSSSSYDDPPYEPSDFFKSIRNGISEYELKRMKNGENLFAPYVLYRKDLLLDYYNKRHK